MSNHARSPFSVAILFFGLVAITILAFLVFGCSDSTSYVSPTQVCCDDGCTTPTHSDPCHPNCNEPTPSPDKARWVCHNGNSKKVTNVQKHLNHGDTLGKCQQGDDDDDDDDGNSKVTICHIPPGNPSNLHTITVGASAVPAHIAHGDYLGACK